MGGGGTSDTIETFPAYPVHNQRSLYSKNIKHGNQSPVM